MAEEFYIVPESPVYNAENIRKIQDTDPVRASTIVNPLIMRLIENIHAVKQGEEQLKNLATAALSAKAYNLESTYKKGDYCTKDGKLYKANQDIAIAEAWTEGHWTETDVGTELLAIWAALSNKASKTQPTSYSAPVADGLTGNIFYWKTEDACVTVELGISKKDELTDWEVLGVLPVGFRPRAQRNFSSGDGTKGACIVSIYNDGNVRVQAVSAGLTGVVGCITYLALEE